ncbi:hypothetical protein V5O48_003450 [Marasmius crinis-equi]|uniref:Nephrocystin 3-like N-terminal domain-containing protein n=1 Tax=Marasmius crinis-equi TaxID=585013 RepID=A0ABR3FSV0_9AGAR
MVPAGNSNYGRDQIITGGGPVTVSNVLQDSLLEKLSTHIAPNALHNSKIRAKRNGCLDGTRGGSIGELGKWIEAQTGGSRVKWVSGGAGVGKSAIAQTLCEKYSDTHLAACHFFSRSDARRNNMDSFVPTLAYQIAKSQAFRPYLTDPILEAVRSDPGIVDVDWEDQFKRLICEPCSKVDPALWKDLPSLIIIDGLDECMDVDESQSKKNQDLGKREGQTRLLSMIQEITSTQPPLPFRFLIFSRPEHTISDFFRTHAFVPDLERLDMRELRGEADGDIELYLRYQFARFPELHPHAGLDKSWPGEHVIQQLTRKSDGHFIYAVTVIQYIAWDDPLLLPPQARLDIVLNPRLSAYPDLSDLDQLYYHILQPFISIREHLLLPILQLIITPHVHPGNPDTNFAPSKTVRWRSQHAIAEILKVDSRQVHIVLSRLRSVLYVPDDRVEEDVLVLHASFSDFLTEKRRSHEFQAQRLAREHYFDMLSVCLFRTLAGIMLKYQDGQSLIQPSGTPQFDLWSIDVWRFVAAVFCLDNLSGAAPKPSEELLLAIKDFDMYRYVNMLHDLDYVEPLLTPGHWTNRLSTVGIGSDPLVLFLSEIIEIQYRVYARCKLATTSLPMSTSPREPSLRLAANGSFAQFFEEDWLAVLPKKHNAVCQWQLKLLIVAMWDPHGGYPIPHHTYKEGVGFQHRVNPHTSLKIFPYDDGHTSQLTTDPDSEVWHFSCRQGGVLKFERVTSSAPIPSGTTSQQQPEPSSLYRWMDSFVRADWEEPTPDAPLKGRRVPLVSPFVTFFKRLLCLD